MSITKIAQVDVGAGGAASITFTAIPSTYTDLQIVLSMRSNAAAIGDSARLAFNGSTTSFTNKVIEGSGSSAVSATGTNVAGGGIVGASSTANTFSNVVINISNYAGSSNKSFTVESVTENNASTAYQDLYAGAWTNTAAITSITWTLVVGTSYVQYSSATLYGISNAGATGATVA